MLHACKIRFLMQVAKLPWLIYVLDCSIPNEDARRLESAGPSQTSGSLQVFLRSGLGLRVQEILSPKT